MIHESVTWWRRGDENEDFHLICSLPKIHLWVANEPNGSLYKLQRFTIIF